MRTGATPVPRFDLDVWMRSEGVDPVEAFAVFDRQDSGYRSYGVEVGADRWFVKVADAAPSHRSFRSAVRFHDSVVHPAILRPAAIDEDAGALRYPWLDGRVLNHATVDGSDRSGLDAFRRLPLADVERAITTVIDAHRSVVDAGFVAIDFYDGSMVYDVAERRMHLIDLDEYAPGPVVVEGERMPGSRSYMAPEEWEHGATVDVRTTVFTLGRMIEHLLRTPDGGWRGTDAARDLVAGATCPEPADRIADVEQVFLGWLEAATAAPID